MRRQIYFFELFFVLEEDKERVLRFVFFFAGFVQLLQNPGTNAPFITACISFLDKVCLLLFTTFPLLFKVSTCLNPCPFFTETMFREP